MRIKVGPSTWAWEPLTPRGVAAFAGAPAHRVWVVALLVALVAAAVVVWFLETAWFPAVERAIQALPAQGEVRQGRLQWRGVSPVRLAGDRFLSLVVDVKHEADLGHEADLCVEFGQNEIRLISLLGYVDVRYPRDGIMPANRPGLQPWWGAWKPVMLAAVGVAVVAGLGVLWFILASLYCLPVWVVGFLVNRPLRPLQAWRLAAAALMPGALIMTAAIFLYGVGWLDLVRLGLALAVHFVVGWIYVFVSPLFLRRGAEAGSRKKNPFARARPR